MSWLADLIAKLWEYFNHAMIVGIDGILYLFPSTPSAVKPATIIAGLAAEFPLAPWSAIVSGLALVGTVLSAKMLWRIVLSFIP